MVVEVTLSQPARDRDIKRVAYATAGIPLYLLVDREFGLITLFSDPASGDYAASLTAPPGWVSSYRPHSLSGWKLPASQPDPRRPRPARAPPVGPCAMLLS